MIIMKSLFVFRLFICNGLGDLEFGGVGWKFG